MPDGTRTESVLTAGDGAGDANGDNWRAALPDELRDAEALARFADVGALAREHIHLQSLIGRKGLIPPGDSATPEERAAFFTALGRPATPEDYDLAGIAPPEGMPWNDAMQAAMLGQMHEAGLSDAQARSLVAAYADMQGTAFHRAVAAQEAASARALAGLEAEWGERFDARLDLAGRAFRAAFGDDYDDVAGLALADGGRVGDHPAFVRAFAALGERMAEPELVGAAAGAARPMSGEMAQLNLRHLEADPDFRAALLDRAHPDHRAAVAKRSALTGIVFGSDDEPDA
jgi:hypothetical protein